MHVIKKFFTRKTGEEFFYAAKEFDQSKC